MKEPRTPAPLARLAARLESAGIAVDLATTYCGQYYDGTDHYTAAPALYLTIDRSAPDFGAAQREAAEKILKRYRKSFYTVWNYSLYHARATVTTHEDRQRLKDAQRTADAFLTAFWRSMHETAESSLTDRARQAAAVAAGRAAIEREEEKTA